MDTSIFQDPIVIFGIIGGAAGVFLIVLLVLLCYLCTLKRRISQQKKRALKQRNLHRKFNNNDASTAQNTQANSQLGHNNEAYNSDYMELDEVKRNKKTVRFMDAPEVIDNVEEESDTLKSQVSKQNGNSVVTFINNDLAKEQSPGNGHPNVDPQYYTNVVMRNGTTPNGVTQIYTNAQVEPVYTSSEEVRRSKQDSFKRNQQNPGTPTSPLPPEVPPKGPEALQDKISLSSVTR